MRHELASVLALCCMSFTFANTANAQETIVVEEETFTVDDAYNCKTQYSVGKHDNWFLQLGAGIGVPLVENSLENGDAKRHITATYNLGVGKWFSPYIGFRFSGYYGAMHWDNVSYSKAKMANLNFDFMWDMCNSLGGVDADRPVSVIPFVGLGGTYVWDIESLNGQVNALRGELATTAAALAAAQAQLPCPEVVVAECPESNAAPMMSTVRFKINSAKISDEEMVNVYNTAQYLKDNPDVNVLIQGYADKDTGTSEYNKALSQKRAQAVYDTLTKTYGIDASRLSIEAEGSAVQPYNVNNWNRIVIFVPGN